MAPEEPPDGKMAKTQDGLYAPPLGPPPSKLHREQSFLTQSTTKASMVSPATTSQTSEGRRPSMFQRLASKLTGEGQRRLSFYEI
jgi:hypothetical protein